jgi:RNA polymerase sigma factor (sigma-70 family)
VSLEKLIVEYQPRLKAFIRKHVANRDDADDILQDVFYQLVKTADNIEQVTAWLYRVARNAIINKGIKKHEEKLPDDRILKDFSELLFNETSPETEYLRSLVWIELENALAELPPEQREAFELTELDGLPVKEIAQTAGIPVNTLLSRKHYAVKHLRNRLSGLYADILCS